MVSVGPKHLSAFHLGYDSGLSRGYKDEANPDTTWTGWALVGGVWILDPVVAVRVAYEANIFLIDSNHDLNHSTFNFMEGHGLDPWRKVGVTASTPPAVATRKDILHIFQIGSDHVLYHKTWDGQKYTPADKLENLGGLFLYSPAAVSTGAKEVFVFAIGLADGNLHHYHWKSDSSWKSKGKLPGVWVGTPSAISTKEGSWDVFGVNSEGTVNHLSYRDGKLFELDVISGRRFQTIDAISVSTGTIDLIGWGVDSAVHHNTWDSKAWGEWESLGGLISKRPVPVSHSPDALSVMVVGVGCHAFILVRDPNTKEWGAWTDLQGTIVSRIA